MAKISKNARRNVKTNDLISKWGGTIIMKTVFENGKIRHYALCEKTGNTARKPKDMM